MDELYFRRASRWVFVAQLRNCAITMWICVFVCSCPERRSHEFELDYNAQDIYANADSVCVCVWGGGQSFRLEPVVLAHPLANDAE